MLLSIVIVSWNVSDLLAACLVSVRRTLPPDLATRTEILVVDNASHDGSGAMVRKRFPGVRLLENRENAGFARACNQGIAAGQGEFVLLLNPDCEVFPGAVALLVEFLKEHGDAVAAGPRLVGPDGALQPSCTRLPTLPRELCNLFHLPFARDDMTRWPTSAPRRVDVLQGACLLLRRRVLDRVGLFDEDYFLYSEEVDLCDRIHRAGNHIFWVPAARVLHHGSASTRQAADPMFRRLYEGKVLFFRKRRGRAAGWCYKMILAGAAGGRLLLSPFALLEQGPKRRRHIDLAKRYGRLLLALPRL